MSPNIGEALVRDGVNGCIGAIEIVTATHDAGNRTRPANDTGMDHAAGYLVYIRRVIVSIRKKNAIKLFRNISDFGNLEERLADLNYTFFTQQIGILIQYR